MEKPVTRKSRLERFILWREQHIREKQFVLVLSFIVGLCCAIAAIVLKMLIAWIQSILTGSFISSEANFLYLVYPVIGKR